MNVSEDKLQAEFHQKHWNEYPKLRKKWWAVPNGGKRNKIEAMKLKATGVISGVWDVHCYHKGQFSIIEFKVGSNILSDNQKEWGNLMESEGAKKYVCYTLEQAEFAFKTIFGIVVP